MRLKLVLIASVLAAIIGAGSGIVIIYFTIGPHFMDPRFLRRAPGSFDLVTLLLPLLVALSASLFVYRHTHRRRKLQAALTVVFAMALSFAIYIVTPFVL
jgi:hypothetical protein